MDSCSDDRFQLPHVQGLAQGAFDERGPLGLRRNACQEKKVRLAEPRPVGTPTPEQ
jgi:hypothetical protein